MQKLYKPSLKATKRSSGEVHGCFPTMLVIFLVSLISCTQKAETTDLDIEREALLAVYELEKRAHISTNVPQLLENSGEQFITVSNGKISTRSREDIEQFFNGYFKNATYQEYNDLEPPIVRVSADGSMGWIVSRLRARRTQIVEEGQGSERDFVYAGIMLYEKRNGKWIRVANVSTFE